MAIRFGDSLGFISSTGVAFLPKLQITNGPVTITGNISGNNLRTSFNQGSATGNYSFAANQGRAYGVSSHAEGISTTASGEASHAEGDSTTASGNYSHAEGLGTTASGSCGHAEGGSTTASGITSHAEGYGTIASGDASHAEGWFTTASGYASHAAGFYSTAANDYSYIWSDGDLGAGVGHSTTAQGQYVVSASGGMIVPGNSTLGKATTINSTILGTPSRGTLNTNARTIYNLASFRHATNFAAGSAIIFKAPTTTSTVMHRFVVEGMLYTQGPFRYVVQGYKGGSASDWTYTYRTIEGNIDDSYMTVHWGLAPDGCNCLILSAISTLTYPHIAITEAMFSHNNATNASYTEGWSVSAVRSLAGYTQITPVSALVPTSHTNTQILVNNATDGLVITQTGAGNALKVSDQVGDPSPFVVTGAGLVGIGTSAPNLGLTIIGSGSATNWFYADNAFVANTNDTASAPGFTWSGDANTGIYHPANATIGFVEDGVEVMRIASTSRVGIGVGVTNPTTTLHVSGSITYALRPAAGTGTALVVDSTSGLVREQSSSLRFKENVRPYNKGISDVLSLNPVLFNYQGENIDNVGFIAEEVEQQGLSEFVVKDAEGLPYSIPYGNFVGLLVNAIKTQTATISALESRVQALENT